MLADTAAIRHLARRMRDRAEDIRAERRRLDRRAAHVPWQGLAAEAMRRHVAGRLAMLATTARLHEEAAEALEGHARAVDAAVAALASAARAVEGAVEGAVNGVEGAVQDAAEGARSAAHTLGSLL